MLRGCVVPKKRSRVSASQPALSGPNETTTAPLRQGEIQDDNTRDPAIDNFGELIRSDMPWICLILSSPNYRPHCDSRTLVLPQTPRRRPRHRWSYVSEHPSSCIDPFLVKKTKKNVASQSIFKEICCLRSWRYLYFGDFGLDLQG